MPAAYDYENPERWRDVGPDCDANGAITNISATYNGINATETLTWDYDGHLKTFNGPLQTNLWFAMPPLPKSLSFRTDALGNRVARADIARFISSDPIGIVGGVNLYAYAKGDPVRFLDALGLCADGSSWKLNDLNSNLMWNSEELDQMGSTVSDLADDFETGQLIFLGAMTGGAAAPYVVSTAGSIVKTVTPATSVIATKLSDITTTVSTWRPLEGLINTTSLQGNQANPLPSVTTPSISTVQFQSVIDAARRILEIETSGGPGIYDTWNEVQGQLQ